MVTLVSVRCHRPLQFGTSSGWCAHAVQKNTAGPSLHTKIYKLQTAAPWKKKDLCEVALETAILVSLPVEKKKYQEIQKKNLVWVHIFYGLAKFWVVLRYYIEVPFVTAPLTSGSRCRHSRYLSMHRLQYLMTLARVLCSSLASPFHIFKFHHSIAFFQFFWNVKPAITTFLLVIGIAFALYVSERGKSRSHWGLFY